VQLLFGFAAVIVTIVGAVVKLTRSIDQAQRQIDSRLERLEIRIASVEGQNRAFLQVFPKVMTSLIRQSVLPLETGYPKQT
jgi:chaperonin cofactor prefoldin